MNSFIPCLAIFCCFQKPTTELQSLLEAYSFLYCWLDWLFWRLSSREEGKFFRYVFASAKSAGVINLKYTFLGKSSLHIASDPDRFPPIPHFAIRKKNAGLVPPLTHAGNFGISPFESMQCRAEQISSRVLFTK